MRSLKIDMPKGYGELVAETCFSCGVSSLTVSDAEQRKADGTSEPREVVNIETSTPRAKQVLDRVTASDYFDEQRFTITLRQPRSTLPFESIRERTYPLAEPSIDLYQELWQFSHITYGLIGRIFIAGCLLAYGLIGQRILFTIGGLLFLPILPMVMAISLGITARKFKLALQGLGAFLVSACLLFAAEALMGAVSTGPMKYTDFSPFGWSLAFSTIVGIAGGLASIDDAGRRELIGLATASQLGIFPTWLGAWLMLDATSTASPGESTLHLVSFFANAAAIIASTAIVLLLTGYSNNIHRIKEIQ